MHGLRDLSEKVKVTDKGVWRYAILSESDIGIAKHGSFPVELLNKFLDFLSLAADDLGKVREVLSWSRGRNFDDLVDQLLGLRILLAHIENRGARVPPRNQFLIFDARRKTDFTPDLNVTRQPALYDRYLFADQYENRKVGSTKL